MINLEGYLTRELILDGKTFSLFSGIHDASGQPVLIRTFSNDYPKNAHKFFLREDFNLSNTLQGLPILEPLELVEQGHKLFAVFKDFGGGIPLKKYLEEHNVLHLDPLHAIKVFKEIVNTLGHLHQQKLVHKCINPSHLFIVPSSDAIRISGFGFSTLLEDLDKVSAEALDIEDMLYYISPEQTGRINRTMDTRSDIYSLGVVFFECLTKLLPYRYSDPLSIMHGHIAVEAPGIESLNPDIPACLSAVVGKMLSKNGEDRYQSLRGLYHDLERCENLITNGPAKATFELGQRDVSDFLRLPEKIFGRSRETLQIRQAFDQIEQTHFNALFVYGPSGIGKSTLIEAAKNYFTKNDSFYLPGTFKVFNKNLPFSGITAALRAMVQQILALPHEMVETWSLEIDKALGGQGKLITNIIPELESLIGEQPDLPDATPEEAENRLKATFLNFIKVFTNFEKKIVLFLDDMHLIDATSVEFLKNLLETSAARNLLFVGSFIDSQIENNKPFQELYHAFKSLPYSLSIALQPLSAADSQDLIAQTLQATPQSVEQLNKLVFQKTKGIPIFIKEFLERVYREKILFFNYDKNKWDWDLHGIEDMPISESVAGLMTAKVNELRKDVQETLKAAACIGTEFNLKMLKALSAKPSLEILNLLRYSTTAGFVQPARSVFQMDYSSGEVPEYAFSFVHDRIQEAIYSQISSAQKKQTHYQIALEYLKSAGDLPKGDTVFKIAGHLQEGYELIPKESPYRAKIIQVFQEAAKSAKLALSYNLGNLYSQNAFQLCGEQEWQHQYEQTFEIAQELLETSYLNGNKEQAEVLFQELLEKAQTRADASKLYITKSSAYTLLSDLEASFEPGRQALLLLGEKVPAHAKQLHVIPEIIKTRIALGNKSHQDLLALPEMESNLVKQINATYFRLFGYAINFNQELYTIMALRLLRNTLRYGIDEHSPVGVSIYGSLLMVGFGQIENGFDFLQLAKKMSEQTQNPASIGSANHGLGYFGYFKKPMEVCIHHMKEGFRLYNISGKIYLASTLTRIISNFQILAGKRLTETRQDVAFYLQFTNRSREMDSYEYQQFCDWWIQSVQLENPDLPANPMDLGLKYRHFTELSLAFYYVFMVILYMLFGKYEEAHQLARQAKKTISVAFYDQISGEFIFWEALAAGLYAVQNQKIYTREIQKTLKRAIKFLHKRARLNPRNYLHQWHLTLGMRELLENRLPAALGHFEKAVQNLPDDGDYLYRGTAWYMMTLCNLAMDQKEPAEISIRKSVQAFDQWDAPGVGMRLRKDYADLFRKKADNTQEDSILDGAGLVDYYSIMKASQLLSSEIEISKLLTNLIRVAIENAGAQRGFLIIEKKGQLNIEAEGSADQQDVKTLQGLPITQTSEMLATSIVHYVFRTKKPAVVNDAGREEQFLHDPYIQQKKPKSITAVPILNKGKLIGILYLENNLTTNAFTPRQQEVLKLLSSQAGISLENATLYSNMADLNRAYERFVPKQFLQFLQKESIVDVGLGDQIQQEMTVMFSDIRDFTSISEKMSPQENFNFINGYLSQMEPVIRSHGGFIDKYIGDAIMALFPSDADQAVQASLGMLAKLREVEKGVNLPLRIGIGLHTGTLMLGTVGGHDRMDGTVISDAVNLASRVEAMTKQYGIQLIITGETYHKLKDPGRFRIRKIDQVIAKGKSRAISIYEVYDQDAQAILKQSYQGSFDQAFQAFLSRNFEGAQSTFQTILTQNPEDVPARILLARCAELAGQDLPDDWSGERYLREK